MMNAAKATEHMGVGGGEGGEGERREVKCIFKVRGKPDRDVVVELPHDAADRLEGGEYE